MVYRLSAEPATLNPITATDVYEATVNSFIYESLLERDNRTLELVPLLAESWEVSPDRMSYIFTLRPGLTWQDGRSLTSRDVVFTFGLMNDPSVDAPHLKSYFRDLVEVEALDERTIRFYFSTPYFNSLGMVGGVKILPEHVFRGGDFNSLPAVRQPLGSGPFRFIRWDTGRQIVLDRNDRYWRGKPHLRRIVFKIIANETVALQVLKKGELDYMELSPMQWVRQTGSLNFKKNFGKYDYYSPSYSFIGWNNRKIYFSDRRVRRAMTMLLDRDSILKNLRYGLGRIVTGDFFHMSGGYNREVEPWPYDPSGAASLLDEAGWRDSDGDGVRDREGIAFRFELTIPADALFAEQVATILQENLRKVGVEMTIRPREWALFTRILDDRVFEAVIMAWNLPVEADPFQVWHSSQTDKGSNFVGFVHAEADRIIEEARTTFDRSRRIFLYRRFHRILHEEQPYTFLFSNKTLVALAKRFHNVAIYPLGLNPKDWYVPDDLQKYQ